MRIFRSLSIFRNSLIYNRIGYIGHHFAIMAHSEHNTFMDAAYDEALISYNEGGIPIGGVLTLDGKIIARGYNKKIQNNDPTSHGETDALKNCGRRRSYEGIILYTTLTPCWMCTGAILFFGIKTVVIGENQHVGGHEALLEEQGVNVIVLNDSKCFELLDKFITEKADIFYESKTK